MDFQNYTQKSLEAVQSAQKIAVNNGHQQLEQVHILLALLQQEGGLVPQLLRKMDVTVESLEAAANAELRKIPSGQRPCTTSTSPWSICFWVCWKPPGTE